MSTKDRGQADAVTLQLAHRFDAALDRLEQARPFAKGSHQAVVLDLAGRLLKRSDGLAALAERAPRFDPAGVFLGSDWHQPECLLPRLVRQTLATAPVPTVVLEVLSELRMLAIARGDATHAGFTQEQARHFLMQILALSLDRVFGSPGEADRERLGELGDALQQLFGLIVEQVGFEGILAHLIDEIWRVLAQRPIDVAGVKAMIAQISVALADGAGDTGELRLGADRLVSALFGPTQASSDDPGLPAYRGRLATLDGVALQHEARGFARAMHDTGLVSAYHALFLRWIHDNGQRELLAPALGLSPTGTDALQSYPALVHRLLDEAIHPETSQAAYGLALLLERGLLYAPPMAPALWRQIHLALSPAAADTLANVFGSTRPPRTHLLAGVLMLLGQPLGIGQGNNPTCQSARALSMWAINDPDFLLHLVVQAARTDSITMHFEGQELRSADLPPGLALQQPLDTDPVSTLLVGHLDRIYAAMGRLCADRGEDPHRWINPEFHGWWVGRDFAIAVDVATGALCDHDTFVRGFYGHYHPYYNGMTPVIHPQPAGLAITDAAGDFVGWHAITLLRVALDQERVMRVYFYNPNNDSGQDWGQGVVVSTQGHGERFGEASLPFEELASRLYIFHFDRSVCEPTGAPPVDEIERVGAMARASWAATRVPPAAAAQADAPGPPQG
ncbi:MAG: hypothetical protein V2I63_02555 [Pseudomonadales bacterium]|nr:hypothetical protein [Pseudomonadales bacterium]